MRLSAYLGEVTDSTMCVVVICVFGRRNKQHYVLWLSAYLREVTDSTMCVVVICVFGRSYRQHCVCRGYLRIWET